MHRCIVWKVLIGVLSTWFSVAAAATVFQHRLIYKPIQKTRIEPEDSRLDRMSVSTIRVPTHDGLVLNGWRATPRDRSPRCSVLFFHGNFGNRTWCWRTLQMFQDLDVEVWLIDYRGYGENPGSPNEADFREDARSMWALLTEDYGIVSDRIVICGYSLGGAVATGLAAELCESGTKPCGLITVAAFSSLTDTAAERFPLLPIRLLLQERWPSAEQMKRVSCPFLHIHGMEDRIVPLNLGRDLFSSAPPLSENRIPKRLVELPRCDHLNLFRDGRHRCCSTIDEFLNQILDDRTESTVINSSVTRSHTH